jgi:hypothetical protein
MATWSTLAMPQAACCGSPWQSEEDRLDTTLHEAIHCCRPELDEKAVTDLANDLSRLLWRMGYRREA